jgi:glutathione S-transferase
MPRAICYGGNAIAGARQCGSRPSAALDGNFCKQTLGGFLMAKLELVSSVVCPFAQRSRIALLEKGVPFGTREIAYVGDSFDKPRWFLDLTPTARVPVLKHGGNVIYESDIVNEYLDETFPEPPLMPADLAARAHVRIWLSFSNGQFLQGFYGVIMSQETRKQEFYKAEFAERLRYMEREGLAKLSGKGPYWLGDKITLADISFYPFFERISVLTHYRGFKLPDECARLKAWAAAMQQRPSVAATRETDAFHIDVYRHYAAGTQKGLTAKEMEKTLT